MRWQNLLGIGFFLVASVDHVNGQTCVQVCGTGTNATAPNVGLSFKATDRSDLKGCFHGANERVSRPDAMGAIGPDHFVQAINGRISIHEKSSGLEISSIPITEFFESVIPDPDPDVKLSSLAADPRVLFDQHSNRWIISAADFTEENPRAVLVAITTGQFPGDPTGDWNRCRFDVSPVDYPTLGVDANAMYISSLTLKNFWEIEKDFLPSNCEASKTEFELPSFNFTVQPAHTYGDPGFEYLVQILQAVAQIRFYEFVTGQPPPPPDPVPPTLHTIDIETFTSPEVLGIGAPQKGTSLII